MERTFKTDRLEFKNIKRKNGVCDFTFHLQNLTYNFCSVRYFLNCFMIPLTLFCVGSNSRPNGHYLRIIVMFGLLISTLTANTMGDQLGDTCTVDENCTVPHSHCSPEFGVCSCTKEFNIIINTTLCGQITRLGDPCLYDKTCQEADPNSVCFHTKVCLCRSMYRRIERRGDSFCQSTDSDESLEFEDDSSDWDDDDDDEHDRPSHSHMERNNDPAPIIAGAVIVAVVLVACNVACYKHCMKRLKRKRRIQRMLAEQQRLPGSTRPTNGHRADIEMQTITSNRPNGADVGDVEELEREEQREGLLTKSEVQADFPPTYEEATSKGSKKYAR